MHDIMHTNKHAKNICEHLCLTQVVSILPCLPFSMLIETKKNKFPILFQYLSTVVYYAVSLINIIYQ